MKNFSFKVVPTQSGLENKQAEQVLNSLEPASVPEMEMAKQCPPCTPLPPQMPCPPMGPMPIPPQMPCPPMGPMPPQMPCPPMGGVPHAQYTAPPFTCPYFRLAHSYVPWQNYDVVYNPAEALHKGTLFPELHMPQGEYGPCEGPRPCRIHFKGGVPYGCK